MSRTLQHHLHAVTEAQELHTRQALQPYADDDDDDADASQVDADNDTIDSS